MNDIASSEGSSASVEKPVILLSRLLTDDVEFPPFPEPTEEEFEEDIGDEERAYYRKKFMDLEIVKKMRLHCSACDRHLGSSTKNESRMRAHPMLRTLVCHICHTFYNSGEFEKGDDGSELYCRWCGQGGQVYCCSNCPHVFCAKCIRRNLGNQKIKEIENTDDWKCFKCNPKCLWELRAVCWALLRYCDMKNKITYKTDDPILKEAYQKDCAKDHTECCKHKSNKRREKIDASKKKDEKKISTTSTTASPMPKLPSSIQVKKFASINLDEPTKDKKAQKRPVNSNENKMVFIKTPITIAPQTLLNPMPPTKKPKMPLMNPVRFAQQERKSLTTYTRIRPKMPTMPTMPIPILNTQFNGYNMNNNSFHNYSNTSNNYSNTSNMVSTDTLNLSLESLTQGLDMVAVAAMNSAGQDDDVVCTPDFPLEPLCEVTEDNTDDDVQCITPGPVAAPKIQTSLASRIDGSLPDLTSENIVQMTENDVTVNALTGGLKFRVDPQTLSSNKMYRLPDGRIFAIKANPSMPGGYSATIVAVTETGQAKSTTKGATYAAKLSAVSSSQTPPRSQRSSSIGHISKSKRSTPKSVKVTRGTDTSTRECDLHVPVEWFRFNLIDAVDALEYSLQRLQKLKKEATCRYLRTRSIDEMKSLHKTLDRLLNTSATRFKEIKENLNKELKQYVAKKSGGAISDDDDDVEILPDSEENDDPIFIDENSVESNFNDLTCHESHEVDLTGVGSSDHNDSTEMINENVSDNSKMDSEICNTEENISKVIKSSSDSSEKIMETDGISNNIDNSKDDDGEIKENVSKSDTKRSMEENDEKNFVNDCEKVKVEDQDDNSKNGENENDIVNKQPEKKVGDEKVNGSTIKEKQNTADNNDESEKSKDFEKRILSEDNQDSAVKLEDSEMSEEMIESLLNDNNVEGTESSVKTEAMPE